MTPVHAENDADVLISQLIGYYTDYMEDSVTDIERVLVELKSVDKKKGEAWDSIMHYWLEVNSPDFTHVSEVPQGLPKDMGEWLLKQGLEPSRLIVENRAQDTVGNAKNTYEVLKTKYPSVKNVVLITSDYHVPRGCILYYTKFVLEGLENNS